MAEQKGIANCIEEGIDLFRGYGEEVKRMYGYLIPEGSQSDPLKTFRREWLGKNGSTEWLESALTKGRDVFKEWPEKVVRRKYGHLIKLMPRVPEGVVESEDEDEQFAPNSSTDSTTEEDEEGTNIPHHTSTTY